MNIKRAAEAAGLTPDTIRFYEKAGVLPRPPRQANRYREYTVEHVATLRLARGLKQLGVSLQNVRPLLEVAHSGRCGEIRGQLLHTLSGSLAKIDAEIAGLQETRQHASLMYESLKSMRPNEAAVPGMEACPCIQHLVEDPAPTLP